MQIRGIVAIVLAFGLAAHGYRKRSLNKSGAAAAVLVGFISFSVSYRMGIILIVFYYTGSRMTKVRSHIKRKLEFNYREAGQRNMLQVFSNSALATFVAAIFFLVIGEDNSTQHVRFLQIDTSLHQLSVAMSHNMNEHLRHSLASYLWTMYIAHYACANGDTWASELGILSKSNPRLITSLFLKKVPRGTNGGVSWEGTLASALGGALIGFTYFICSILMDLSLNKGGIEQYPMILAGLCSGLVGSIVDSLLGATLQATYFDAINNQIIKTEDLDSSKRASGSVKLIQGVDILSNEAVNFFSIAITMILSCLYTPAIFKMMHT